MSPGRLARSALMVVVMAILMLTVGALFTPGVEQASDGLSPPADRPSDETATVHAASAKRLDGVVTGLQHRLRLVPRDHASWAALGQSYVQLAAVTGNPTYYPRARGALRRSLRILPEENADALTGLAALAAARHDFPRARRLAGAALRINPYSAVAYGVRSDALIQLGRYRRAFDALQEMLDLEPGVPSFTRASYAWELLGETGRAHSALRRALTQATMPSDVAFCRYYLGELAWQTGDLAAAERHYTRGVAEDPSYTPLLVGQAKIAAAQGRTANALRLYARATHQSALPGYVVAYGDLLSSLGRHQEARRQYAVVDSTDALLRRQGVRPDAEMVLFATDRGRPAEALESARRLWRAQRGIDAADAYAWALHVNGRDTQARELSRLAARLGTRSALFDYHRGMIERALGNERAARRYLSRALALNPYFSPVHAPRAQAALDALATP